MNDLDYRIVEYYKYCKKCKYYKLEENEKPCDNCLANPINQYTDRPTDFEPAE